MASKLTPEQKALNKEATKLRDRAYFKRKNAWSEEREAIRQSLATGPEGVAAKAADQAMTVAMAEREAELAAVRAEIEALNRKLADLQKAHDAKIEPLHAERQATWRAHHNALQAAENALDAAYSDVAKCWSAAAWKSFNEFLPLVGKADK